jgi:uncharacterized membrane protein YhaH (DUF805 family)
MKYFVKMTHYISDAFYQVLRDHLMYGTGQGSRASHAIWLSIVVCLLMALTTLAPLVMMFADPWGDILTRGMWIPLSTIHLMDVMMHIWRWQCPSLN